MAMAVPGTSGVLGQGAEEQKGETARLVILITCYRVSDRDSALLCRLVINNSAFSIRHCCLAHERAYDVTSPHSLS